MHFRQWKRREFITLLGGAAAASSLLCAAAIPSQPRLSHCNQAPPLASRGDLDAIRNERETAHAHVPKGRQGWSAVMR
jgi:hypothetical protein